MQCNDLRLTSLIYISQKSKLKLLHNSCNSNPFQLPHAQFIPSTGTDSLWSEENEEDSQYFTPTNFLQLSQSCALLHPLISHCSPPPSNFLSAELPCLGTAQHPCPGSVLIPAGCWVSHPSSHCFPETQTQTLQCTQQYHQGNGWEFLIETNLVFQTTVQVGSSPKSRGWTFEPI